MTQTRSRPSRGGDGKSQRAHRSQQEGNCSEWGSKPGLATPPVGSFVRTPDGRVLAPSEYSPDRGDLLVFGSGAGDGIQRRDGGSQRRAQGAA